MLQATENDETVHVIYPVEKSSISSDRLKESAVLKKILSAVCALLNSNGGKVVLHIDNLGHTPSIQKISVIRKLEQSMISIIGIQLTNSNISLKEDKESIVIYVKKADYLITTNYNLYLPSQTQVVQVLPLEPLEKIREGIIKRKAVQDEVQHGSHCKVFVKDKHCGFSESKMVELKYLRSDRAKRTNLADRMTGKGNKFSCYVSAFANHRGGHMYDGINDDGIVKGEFVSSEEEKHGITKKVTKTINKIIWPELIGQAKRGVQWDIFFEPVVDENNGVIPSTFVIVVYIAACLGGVFTEEPECYEMVEGKVEKMSFATWKRRMLQPIELVHSREIPSMLQRITWGSTRTQRICTRVDQLLTQSVNNGKSIELVSKNLEQRLPGMVEVQLVILSKKVMVCYRNFCFAKAQMSLKKYVGVLTRTPESGIFDAIRAYIEVALHRAEEEDILAHVLDMAKKIPPGLIAAGIYLLVATVMSKEEHVANLSILALQHLQYVEDSPIVRADMEQKVHITLALSYLGYNLSGKLTKPQVDSKSLEKAKSSVAAVNKSIDEGSPMNRYREVQFKLVQSVLFYRHSQIQLDREKTLLYEAFNYSQKAKCLASEYGFEEMVLSAKACMALCTEGLVRTHFKPSHSSVNDVDFLLPNLEAESSEIKTHAIPTASNRLEPGTKEKDFLLPNAKDKSSQIEINEIPTDSTRCLESTTKNDDFLLLNPKTKSSPIEKHEISTDSSTRLKHSVKEIDVVPPNPKAKSSQIEISTDDVGSGSSSCEDDHVTLPEVELAGL